MTIADHLFWMQELGSQKRWTPEPWTSPKRQRPSPQYPQQEPWSPQGKGKGNSKNRNAERSPSVPSVPWPTLPKAGRGKGSKSEGKGRGRGKSGGKAGKSPGKTGKTPKRFATVNPRTGKNFCGDWQWGKCRTNCGLSHVCNIYKADGTICMSTEHGAGGHQE